MKKFLLSILIMLSASGAVFSSQSLNGFSTRHYTIFSSKFSVPTPFWVKVGDTNYYFLKTRTDGNYSYKDLVGCDRKKKQLFESLYELDSDKDLSKITSEELKKAGIRLVSVKINGKLEINDTSKDFPIDNVHYIDMTNTATYSDRFARPSGTFAIYMKTDRSSKQKIIGHSSYRHPRRLKPMF